LRSEKETADSDGKCEKLYKFVGQTDRKFLKYSLCLFLSRSLPVYPLYSRFSCGLPLFSLLFASLARSFLVSVSRLGVARVSERSANTSIFNETAEEAGRKREARKTR
jgi:hypothetical protein